MACTGSTNCIAHTAGKLNTLSISMRSTSILNSFVYNLISFAGPKSTPTQQSSQSQASVQIASQQPQQAQQQQQQQSIMINNYEEPGDDSIVPSTPTLYVPRRADGFSEAVSSPQSHVRISRFSEVPFIHLPICPILLFYRNSN